MRDVLNEEEAVRRFAEATLALLRTCRAIDHSQIVGEIRRIAKETHESEVASYKSQQAVKPILLDARQAAKSLSISRGTLFNLTLRSQNRDARLSPPYLLPFRTLLRLAAESSPERFTQTHADALAGFATRVESLWASSR